MISFRCVGGLNTFPLVGSVSASMVSALRVFVRRRHEFEILNNKKDMSTPVLYHSVQEVLNILKDEKYKNSTGVPELLQLYDSLKAKVDNDAERNQKLHPLIVLEGLDGCGKSTISRKLSNKINGTIYRTPPPSMSTIRSGFEDHSLLRTAFYALGNYIAALEMINILKMEPIVLDRYWHSTAAFAIAQTTHDYPGDFPMPPKGDPIYNWPSDLLKPNLVIMLDVCEPIRIKRLSSRSSYTNQENLLTNNDEFRNNVITAYKNVANPQILVVDANMFPNKLIPVLLERTKHLFN